MSSWRDSASPEAQADLDGLVGDCLQLALQNLAKYGELVPFAMTVTLDGQQGIQASLPPGDGPMTLDFLGLLTEALRQSAPGLRAIAVIVDVRLEQSDGVRMQLEHREGHAITVVLPYTLDRQHGRVIEGELLAMPGDSTWWS